MQRYTHSSPFKIKIKILRNSLLLLLTFSITNTAICQSNKIIIDESYNDWFSITTNYTDGLDNPNGIDLLEMQVTNDADFLYVKFSVTKELALANTQVNHTISLSIDADNNPKTGFQSQSGYGSELVLDFNGHSAWFYSPTPNVQVGLYDLELRVAPTFTDTIFEMAIPRGIKPDTINKLFDGDTIRLLIKDDLNGDRMPNTGKVFTYVFDNSPADSAIFVDLMKINRDHIRLVSHNVLNSNAFSTTGLPHLEQIVKALEADLYCFQESTQPSALTVKTFFDLWLPQGTRNGWYIYKDGERITCSKWPISKTWNLWRKTVTLIDLPSSYSKDLLVINAHLSCCTKNQDRQDQVDEFAQFILDAKSIGGLIDLPQNTPVIFLGDMNLVGLRQQHETILTGDIQDELTYGKGGALDWDSTDLKDAVPLHIDSSTVYTWRNLSGNGFPPGRLDFQYYTDAAITLEKSFILQTETMNQQLLTSYNLQSANTLIADHLPLVVDYSLKSNTSAFNSFKKDPSLIIYPNPAGEYIIIDSEKEIESLTLTDIVGRIIVESNKSNKKLKLTEVSTGVYLLKIKFKEFDQTIVEKISVR